MFRRLALWVLSHRLPTALLLLVVIGGTSLGGMWVQVDFSVRAFFADDSAAVDQVDAHMERWGVDDASLLVLVDGQGSSVLTRERLELVQELDDALSASPLVDDVRSVSEAPRIARPFPGVVVPRTLLQTLPGQGEPSDAWRRDVLADPALVPSLLAASGELLALKVDLLVDTDDIGAMRPALAELQILLDTFDGRAGVHITPAGIPAVRAGLLDVLVRDQMMFVPIALGVIALLMVLLFRRPHGVIIPLLAALVPTVMVFGVLGYVDEPIGLINQTYLTLIPVIATADAIHMVSRYHEELRKRVGQGHADQAVRNEAIIEAMHHVGIACALTTFTTAVGFASLLLASMPVLKSFGFFAALGIVFAYGTVLILVPLCLSVVPSASPRTVGPLAWMDRGLQVCAELAVNRPKVVVGAFVLVVAAAVGFGTQVTVNNWVTNILPPDNPVSLANAQIDEHLGGLVSLDIAVQGEDLRDPAVLQALFETGDATLALDPVREVLGPARMVASSSALMGGAYAVPTEPAAVNTLLDAAPEVTHLVLRPGHARLIVRARDVGALDFQVLVDQVQEIVDTQLVAQGIDASVTGTAVIAYAGINRVTSDLRDSLSTAFLVIVVLIAVLFKSLRTGLISILPNAAPLLIGYGFMGVMGWDLEPGPAVVFTVALGIAVDDSIHLLARFREERRAGRDRADAVRQAVHHAGSAVGVTSVILASGFAINTLSDFPMNRTFGALGAVIIVSALASDVLLLPALLALFSPDEPVDSAAPAGG
jgi:predicted RND superfamily exporter protein